MSEVLKMKNYDNFILPAGDLEKGKDFYQGILGMPVKFEFPEIGMVAFKVGEEEPAIILSNRPDTQPTIWFEVKDVKTAFRELTEKGIRFISEPFQIKTGLAVEFFDPFGNKLGMTDYTALMK